MIESYYVTAQIPWHIDNSMVTVFTGLYDDYMREIKQKRAAIEKELVSLKRNRKETHHALMKEQKRAATSRAKGQKQIDQRRWPTVVSKSKALKAEQTSGKKKSVIERKKQHLTGQLSALRLPEMIMPKFSLGAESVSAGNLLSIIGADLGYAQDHIILNNVSLTLGGNERIAIKGKNASGESTLLRAILGKEEIFKTGCWQLPHPRHIGYLDQHYANLQPGLSVLDHLQQVRPDWAQLQVRRHLADFLFKTNEAVGQKAAHLSGGEKVRLSLSLIAARVPRILVLDEITNNLDLETKEHVVQVLKTYPGAVVIVSHENDVLNQVGVDCIDTIQDGLLVPSGLLR